MVSYSVKIDSNPVAFSYHSQIDFLSALRKGMEQAKLIIGHNLKFDLHWAARNKVFPNEKVRLWDTQIAEFIISGQQHTYPSLDECLAKYGLPAKDDKIAEYWALGIDTQDIPIDELQFYNDLDVDLTYQLYLKQLAVMTKEQIRLCYVMGLDLIVLQEMEANGIKFDTELCQQKAKETSIELAQITKDILAFCPTPDINLDSGQHLSCFLYGGKFDVDYVTEVEAIYKSGSRKGETYLKNQHDIKVFNCEGLFKPLPKSETKLKKKIGDEEVTIYFTNEKTLQKLRKPTKTHKRIIELILRRAELGKLLETYYGALPALIETMEWGGYLYGQYNQVGARTGRLSSNKP